MTAAMHNAGGTCLSLTWNVRPPWNCCRVRGWVAAQDASAPINSLPRPRDCHSEVVCSIVINSRGARSSCLTTLKFACAFWLLISWMTPRWTLLATKLTKEPLFKSLAIPRNRQNFQIDRLVSKHQCLTFSGYFGSVGLQGSLPLATQNITLLVCSSSMVLDGEGSYTHQARTWALGTYAGLADPSALGWPARSCTHQPYWQSLRRRTGDQKSWKPSPPRVPACFPSIILGCRGHAARGLHTFMRAQILEAERGGVRPC